MTTLHLPTLANMLSLDDEHMEYIKDIILRFAMLSQHYILHELLCVHGCWRHSVMEEPTILTP